MCRPPATIRDYPFVGDAAYCSSAPGFTTQGFLRSAYLHLPSYFYCLLCRQCGPTLLFPFHVPVATSVICFSPSDQVSRVSCFFFVIASAQSFRIRASNGLTIRHNPGNVSHLFEPAGSMDGLRFQPRQTQKAHRPRTTIVLIFHPRICEIR
jgi:hypothetical protein